MSIEKQKFMQGIKSESDTVKAQLYEQYKLCDKIDMVTFSSQFVTPNVWKKLPEKFQNISVESEGFFETSDRKLIKFQQTSDTIIYDYPAVALKITGQSKFHTLAHKDFLGAIMALGIKREKIGDLVVINDVCYMVVVEEMAKVIRESVVSVGKSPCVITEIPLMDLKTLKATLKETECSVSALRLDSIVAKIAKISREDSVKLIESGQVFVDYLVERSKKHAIIEGDILTIKKIGKFKVGAVYGTTQSNRLKIKIFHYS